MTAPATPQLNPSARFDLRRIGREGHPVIVVDDVLTNPDVMIEAAKNATYTRPDTMYPGLHAPLPESYANLIVGALRPMLTRIFGIPNHVGVSGSGNYGLAIDAPDAVTPIQKIPHHDSLDPFRIASVHYLCHQQGGGTAFFRHRATGFEGVDGRRREAYVMAASAELATDGERLTRHVHAETPNYDMIDHVAIAFNRMLIYRSHVLHSGLLDEADLSEDPAVGRLTANLFMDVVRS